MDKKDKRKKILKVTGLVGLFLLVFGLSYALFTVTLNGTKKVKVKTGKLELQLLDSNNNDITDANNAGYVINLENQVPVDDETGLGTQAFEFKLKNNGSIKASYTIYLDDVALEVGENRIADEYIKYSLTKNGSSDEAKDLTILGENPNRKLDKGTLDINETNTYTLKVWIKESATNEAMNKVFNTTLRVEGTQYVAPESPYGTKIAERQITETMTATYYQPEDTGYNAGDVKRMSNVRKLDDKVHYEYEGGTLVISGTGEIPDFTFSSDDDPIIYKFLADVNTTEELWDTYDTYNDSNFLFKYIPREVVIGEGITKIGAHSFPSTAAVKIEIVHISDTVTTVNYQPFVALRELYIEREDISSYYLNEMYFEEDAVLYCKYQSACDWYSTHNSGSGLKANPVYDPTKFE